MMTIDWKIKGIILCMEKMGAVFDGISPPHILFTIPKESRFYHDKAALKRGSEGFAVLTGLIMKVKYEKETPRR